MQQLLDLEAVVLCLFGDRAGGDRMLSAALSSAFPTSLRGSLRLRMGQKTHRLPAWGVLGSDNRWDRFSLLTLLFSGVFVRLKHSSEEKFRRVQKKLSIWLSP